MTRKLGRDQFGAIQLDALGTEHPSPGEQIAGSRSSGIQDADRDTNCRADVTGVVQIRRLLQGLLNGKHFVRTAEH